MLSISHQNGALLKRRLSESSITVQNTIPIPYLSHQPIVTLWLDPVNVEAYDFMIKFYKYRKHLGDKIKFIPVMRFQNLIQEGLDNVKIED